MIPTQQEIVDLLGTNDWGLAGYIFKKLDKSLTANGPEFFEALLSELRQPYTTGFYSGFNGWTKFKKISKDGGMKFGVWNKTYQDASNAVFARREFKPIGPIVREVTEDLLEKSLKNSGLGEAFS